MGHVNSYQQDPTLCSSIVYQLSETSGGQVRTRTAGKTSIRSTSNATLNTQDSKEMESVERPRRLRRGTEQDMK